MQPKQANGSWTGGFNPTSQSNFVEGTSWQYTGMVPFNIAGLAAAKGGNAAMISYLNSVLAGFHGSGGSQADLGNEPSLYLPWEYDYVGPAVADAAGRPAGPGPDLDRRARRAGRQRRPR